METWTHTDLGRGATTVTTKKDAALTNRVRDLRNTVHRVVLRGLIQSIDCAFNDLGRRCAVFGLMERRRKNCETLTLVRSSRLEVDATRLAPHAGEGADKKSSHDNHEEMSLIRRVLRGCRGCGK